MNRTKRIAVGSFISVSFSLLQMILALWKTKLVISSFGVDVNSINAAAAQVFSYVVLLEGGIGAGFLYKMYGPMAEGDKNGVNQLYNGLRYSMKRVAIIMGVVLIAVSFLYPLVLADNQLGYPRIVLILLLLSARMMIPYYFSVHNKQMLIISEQQYILSLIDGSINLAFSLTEVFMIAVLHSGFETVLLVGILFTGLNSFLYYWAVMRTIKPFVAATKVRSMDGIKMTKDIMFHKLCYIANAQIDLLILSFLDLFKTTVYSAYNGIINYPTQIINKVITNIRGTIGIKLNSNAETESYSLFKEIFALNTFIASVVCCVFIIMINDFIGLWLGKEFLVSRFAVVLYSMCMFNAMLNESYLIIRDGKGLYKESKWYTLATAIGNLVLSIVLVKKLGIEGLLLATVMCTYLIMDVGNILLIFNKVFHKKPTVYFDYLRSFCAILVGAWLGGVVHNSIYMIMKEGNYVSFAVCAMGVSALVILVTYVIFYASNYYFRRIINRIIHIR